METQRLIPSEIIKQELDDDYEDQTLQKEVNGGGKSDMSLVIKRTSTISTSLSCPDEESVIYCEKCQLKYEGDCPEHGPLIYIDNAEVDRDEYCRQDWSLQVQIDDSKDAKVPGREKVEHLHVCEAHSVGSGTLSNGDCSRRSDQMFSVLGMNTELGVAGISCGLQGKFEVKTHQKVHSTGGPLTYDVYGVEFTCSNQLNGDKRTYTGEKSFRCDNDMCSVMSSALITDRTQAREKPFKCDECGISFFHNGHLIRHKTKHTGVKPYKCDICDVRFTRNEHLIQHKRTHTGEKPFKCDVCGVGFAHSGSLKDHRTKHTGEKPYKCDICGLEFAHRRSLIDHKTKHTGVKPYKCDICGLGFIRKEHLNQHKRTHTAEKS